MHRDWRALFVALGEIIALENPRHGIARAKADHVLEPQRRQPLAVEADLGLLWIEDLEDLLFVRFGVLVDLLTSEWGAPDVAAGGIADHDGPVADHKDEGLAGSLKEFHLAW